MYVLVLEWVRLVWTARKKEELAWPLKKHDEYPVQHVRPRSYATNSRCTYTS
jgi:hypothetical protein